MIFAIMVNCNICINPTTVTRQKISNRIHLYGYTLISLLQESFLAVCSIFNTVGYDRFSVHLLEKNNMNSFGMMKVLIIKILWLIAVKTKNLVNIYTDKCKYIHLPKIRKSINKVYISLSLSLYFLSLFSPNLCKVSSLFQSSRFGASWYQFDCVCHQLPCLKFVQIKFWALIYVIWDT